MVVVCYGLKLLWATTLVLFILIDGSLGWPSSSLCDLKGCSCHAGGAGRLGCDCKLSESQELILESGTGFIPSTISSITIENCEAVHITGNAFSLLTALQSINLHNIDNLDLDEHSFYWNNAGNELQLHPGIKINIINAYIEELPSYTFRGMIHTILLQNCTIEDVQVFSFASLTNMERIDIIDTKIDNIQSQAFKKFSLNTFTIYNSRLPILPSRSMIDIEITNELRFERVEFDVIRSASVQAYGMQVLRLLNNRINRLEKESLNINTKGSVIVQNNLIVDVMTDSIKGIQVDKRYLKELGRQDFTFMNNSVVSFENNPFTFNTTEFTPRIESLNILKQCTCEGVKKWLTKSVLLGFATHNKNNNIDTVNDNRNFGTRIQNIEQIPDVSSLTTCLISNQLDKGLVTIKQYEKSNCLETSYKKYLITLSVILVSILLIIGLIYLLLRNRMKRYINVPTSNVESKIACKNSVNTRNPIMVVPEGKTYRETELHVIVEQAEPIVEYVPTHKTYEN